MQAWKHQAMEGMETLGRPGVEISGGFGNIEKFRHGDTRQVWKHQATRGVETLSRRGDIKQVWRHKQAKRGTTRGARKNQAWRH